MINYLCALDIGSSKIAACVAVFKKKRLENIFFETIPSKGMREGMVVDSIALVNTVSKAMKNLKNKSGINIKIVSTNISGQDIITKHSRAIVPLAERGNKVITVSDIDWVNEQARILGSSLEEEIIQAIPSGYTIDSKANIPNPLGLYSHRLESDLYLIMAKLASVQSLTRVINQSGYEIKNLFFSGLASRMSVFSNELKNGLNIFCDIGSDTTEILFFKDGALRDLVILALGGDDFTKSLQDALKIPFELAEDIKRSHGIIGNLMQISEDKEILVKKSNFYKPIKQRMVAEIVAASAACVCLKIKEAVEKKALVYEVNNFVVVGRTILLEGFIETLENTLNIPVKVGRISNAEIANLVKENSELSGQKYLNYLTSLGILCESMEKKPLGILPIKQPAKNLINKAVSRFKEVYQEYF